MSHKVSFRFEDGVEVNAEVEDNVSVLDSALAAGIQLVHQCKSGSCASCICSIVEGNTEVIGGRASSLLKSEFEQGKRLSCSILATSPLLIDLPYPYSLTLGDLPSRTSGMVKEVQRLSVNVWHLEVDLQDDMHFEAGQYFRIRIPDIEEWRSYSVATVPDDLPRVGFLIKERSGGLMTEALKSIQIGQNLDLEGPFGSFTLRKKASEYILVAGGTGLAPILSILDALREAPGRRPKIHLAFACSREEELFYLDELELRRQWMPNLSLSVGVSRPDDSSWSGLVGNPVQLLETSTLSPDAIVYVCGAPGLVDAMREMALANGISDRNIIAEQYVPEANPISQ